MKIASVETLVLAIPYAYDGPRHQVAGKDWTTMDTLLVRVTTQDGLVGWGEAFGHGAIPATKAALDSLVGPLMVGMDALDIAATMKSAHQAVHLYGRGGPMSYALSGIDIALWDLAGKRANQPLHRLLGGGGGPVQAYASLLRYTDPAIVARNAAAAVARGYRAVKLHELTVEAVRAARAAVGSGILLMNDTNCPWSPDQACAMADAMRPLGLHWLEEPVWPPEDFEGLARVRARGVPVAAGENAASLVDFRHMMQAGAVDLAQPSVTKIGGITELRKVVALGEAMGVQVVPHCAYFGPGFMASLHCAAAMPARPMMERLFIDLEASPFSPWTEAVAGMLAVPTTPGLGCDPDPELLHRFASHP